MIYIVIYQFLRGGETVPLKKRTILKYKYGYIGADEEVREKFMYHFEV